MKFKEQLPKFFKNVNRNVRTLISFESRDYLMSNSVEIVE